MQTAYRKIHIQKTQFAFHRANVFQFSMRFCSWSLSRYWFKAHLNSIFRGFTVHKGRGEKQSTIVSERLSTPTRRRRTYNVGLPEGDQHPPNALLLHRGCEYSKAFAVLGPKILLLTIKDSVYPALLCLSAASSRVCNGG